MFLSTPITGDALPPKTVTLSYDDGPGRTGDNGPGPRTLELAAYLHSQGIPATFFVLGERAAAHQEILAQLADMGHLIANHTTSHPDLVTLFEQGGDPAAEIAAADAVIRPFITGKLLLFRPPFGYWHTGVAHALNQDSRTRQYVGPILWDVDGKDWACWRAGSNPPACAEHYFRLIEQVGRGIILMHDSSAEEDIRRNNQTFTLTRLLVPLLQQHGYRFVRLDTIPQVVSAAQVSAVVAFQAADDGGMAAGHFLSLLPGGDGRLSISPVLDEGAMLGLVTLDQGVTALRLANGRFLAVTPDGELVAGSPVVDDGTAWQLESVGPERVALRVANGRYLSLQSGVPGRFLANSFTTSPQQSWRMIPVC